VTNVEEQDLKRAQEEMVGPVPTIDPAPDCLVDLLRGLQYNGQDQRRAEVREMTGNDEEQLARYKRSGEIFDAVIALGTVRIGNLDLASMPLADRQGHLRQLLVGERDVLFLNIARVTYGDDRRFPHTCSRCGRAQDLGVKLSEDFKPKVVNNIDERSFNYRTSRGEALEVRLATGADQMEILRKEGLTNAEMNTTLLSACILSVNGGMVVDPLSYAKGMTMKDRQELLDEMAERQPSIDLSIKFPCHGCQEDQQLNFNWLDFFRLQ
jgi:hypothetical protein